MPLTVITLKSSPPSLRGDLTKWMQEISTGVYVGNFNVKIREELWKRVVESVGTGEATMSYAYRNEIGYNFETHNSEKVPIDFDGIPLVFTPNKTPNDISEQQLGFSKQAKMRKTKIYSGYKEHHKEKPYVVIDLETTGLDPYKDRIIEMAAVKVGDKIEEYTCIVNQNIKLSNEIKELTGITEYDLQKGIEESIAINELKDFIGDTTILGYNVSFDISFINEALKRLGKSKLTNNNYDIMRYVKQDKMFLKNYKLETVLKEYEINSQVPHRALEDAKLIQLLACKLNNLMEKLKKA